MRFRLANVSKALASVDRIFDAGNEVVFNNVHGSYIRNHATNEKTPIQRKCGVYVLDVWVAPPSSAAGKGSNELSHLRQEEPARAARCQDEPARAAECRISSGGWRR